MLFVQWYNHLWKEMKLGPDCIRDILLRIEACTDLDTAWGYEADNMNDGPLSQYSSEKILYHAAVITEIIKKYLN